MSAPDVFVRIDGAWVELGGAGADEVWIGPDEPTDPNVELWVDEDDDSGGGGSGGPDEVWVGNDPPATPGDLWVDMDAVPTADIVNEVFVGPDTPTDPNAELWFDTDAVPVYDPSKMPRGFVAKIDSTLSGTLPANVTSNMMAGTNVLFQAGRRYRITINWGANRGAAVAQASIAVMGGATTLMGYWMTVMGSWDGHCFVGYFLGDGTTKSVFATINPGGTTMDHSGCYVLIEDIGGV